MKIKIIIAAIIAAIGIGGGATAATLYFNDEEVVLRNSLIGVYDDALEREDVSSVIDIVDDGSISFELNSMKHNQKEILDGAKFSGKVYFSQSALMVDNVTLDYGSKSIDLSAYIGEDSIYIDNSQVLGGAYGVDLKNDNLGDLLEDSIFAPNSNSQYALDEDIYAVINNSLGAYSAEDISGLKEEIKGYTTRYVKKCWDIFTENSSIESKNKELKISGEKTKVRVLTVEFDNDELGEMLEALIGYIEVDEELYDRLEETYNSSNLEDTFEKPFDEFWEDTIDNMYSAADEICRSNHKYEIEIITPKMSSKMLCFKFRYDNKELLKIDFGKDGVKKTSIIEISISDYLTYVYEISETSNGVTKISLDGKYDNEKETLFELKINEDKDNYTLNIYPGYDFGMTVKGTLTRNKNNTTLTIDKFDDYALEAEIIFNNNDKMPEKKDFTNPLEISETELNKIFERLEKEIDTFYEKFEIIYENLYEAYDD